MATFLHVRHHSRMSKEYTPIYEIVILLEGFEEPLVTHIEQKEYDRLVDALKESERKDRALFAVQQARGLPTYINLDRVLYIACSLTWVEFLPRETRSHLRPQASGSSKNGWSPRIPSPDGSERRSGNIPSFTMK